MARYEDYERLQAENERLRAGLQRATDDYQRRHVAYRPVEHPTEYGRGWHDGYHTAVAHYSIVAREALDPEGVAGDREAIRGSDQEWFERTGHCGHCGMLAEDCMCTDDDPCRCGPHERRTEPRDCWYCKGTGQVQPFHTTKDAR